MKQTRMFSRINIGLVPLLLLLAGALFFVGCGSTGDSDSKGSDHSGHEHSHH